MIRTWVENVRVWGLGLVLDVGEYTAFFEVRLGRYRVTGAWIDDRLVEQLAEKLICVSANEAMSKYRRG